MPYVSRYFSPKYISSFESFIYFLLCQYCDFFDSIHVFVNEKLDKYKYFNNLSESIGIGDVYNSRLMNNTFFIAYKIFNHVSIMKYINRINNSYKLIKNDLFSLKEELSSLNINKVKEQKTFLSILQKLNRTKKNLDNITLKSVKEQEEEEKLTLEYQKIKEEEEKLTLEYQKIKEKYQKIKEILIKLEKQIEEKEDKVKTLVNNKMIQYDRALHNEKKRFIKDDVDLIIFNYN